MVAAAPSSSGRTGSVALMRKGPAVNAKPSVTKAMTAQMGATHAPGLRLGATLRFVEGTLRFLALVALADAAPQATVQDVTR